MKKAISYRWALKNINLFNQLAKEDKKLFLEIYSKHQATLDDESKEKWTATSVTKNKKFFIVLFKNNEWLHYYFDGT